MNNRCVGNKVGCYFVAVDIFRDNSNALAILTKLLIRVKYDNVRIQNLSGGPVNSGIIYQYIELNKNFVYVKFTQIKYFYIRYVSVL